MSGEAFKVGDRVRMLVDVPGAERQAPAGSTGEVHRDTYDPGGGLLRAVQFDHLSRPLWVKDDQMKHIDPPRSATAMARSHTARRERWKASLLADANKADTPAGMTTAERQEWRRGDDGKWVHEGARPDWLTTAGHKALAADAAEEATQGTWGLGNHFCLDDTGDDEGLCAACDYANNLHHGIDGRCPATGYGDCEEWRHTRWTAREATQGDRESSAPTVTIAGDVIGSAIGTWAKILHEKIAELQPPLRVADFLESTPPTTNGHWLDAKEKLAAEASKLNERLWKDPDLRPFGLMTKGPRTVVVGDIIHADYGHQEGPILHGAERAAYIRIAAGIDPPPTPPEPPPTCVACSDTGYIPGLAVPVVPCPRCGR